MTTDVYAVIAILVGNALAYFAGSRLLKSENARWRNIASVLLLLVVVADVLIAFLVGWPLLNFR